MKKTTNLFLVIVLSVLLIPVSSASTIYIKADNGTSDRDNNSNYLGLMLDEAPEGLSGYSLEISVSDPSVATITGVSFPSWAELNSTTKIPAGSCVISAIDLENEVRPGTKDIPLADVMITGAQRGSADIAITVTRMDDHSGGHISPVVQSAEIAVENNCIQFTVLPAVIEDDDPVHPNQEVDDTESDPNDGVIDTSSIQLPQLQFDTTKDKVVVDCELSPASMTTIDEKEYLIPSGSIIYHDGSGTTTVFDSSGMQLFSSEDSQATEVWTPEGLKPATHVHEVPSGSFVDNQGNTIFVIHDRQVILVIIDEGFTSGSSIESYTKSAPPDWPPNYVEGIEYNPTVDLRKYSTNWTIPNVPSDTEFSTVNCMWNGLHRTTLYSAVIQPVVSWNEDGDQFFKGRVWQATNFSYIKSSAITTRPGNEVGGNLTWDEELEYWKIVLRNYDNPDVTSLYSNVVPNTECQAALMIEGQRSCYSENLFGYVIFHNSYLQSMTGEDITPPVESINVYITDERGWLSKCPGLDIYTRRWPDAVLFRTGNSHPVPIPGWANPPTDPDSDYFTEDLNGNGQLDLNDVVVYFNNIAWIDGNEPIDCFDYNKNARIDLNDIVVLFQEMI
ncbi:MAG: hypothetical protein WC382_13500 [Methanoregulaceae archaeon]|jgi:PKD repeat protein